MAAEPTRDELSARLRVLEHENELLTDRAEDTALLGAVAGVGAETPKQVIAALVEGLCLLKAIPFAAFVAKTGEPAVVRELGRYCADADERAVELAVPPSLLELERARVGPPEGEVFRGMTLRPPAGSFDVRTVAAFPLRCEAAPRALLILADDQGLSARGLSARGLSARGLSARGELDGGPERLKSLQPLIEQLLMVVSDKLDRLFLMRRLERVAGQHQRRAEERGQQLDRVNAELLRAQRMESLGRLAGGLAHDFNNLLSPIISYAELLALDLAGRPDQLADLEEILLAAKRARELTGQILAFSRKQVLAVKVLDLGAVLGGFSRVLRGALREDVSLEVRLPADKALVSADAAQLEQILLNLVINAQDAMPLGGRVELGVQLRQRSAAGDPAGRPRSWVALTVADDGHGMDEQTQAQVFEPFFTTKEEGKGTGLGLSTVYGLVTQHGGFIELSSAPGAGCRFELYFPHVDDAEDASALTAEGRSAPKGASRARAETILLVEDEVMVRKLVSRILSHAGYEVLEAEHAEQAEQIAAARRGSIALLLTDVVMPGKNGRQLYEQLVAEHDGLRVLYTSGHSEDVLGFQGLLDPGIALLRKPVAPSELLEKVRAVLDG